MLVRLLILFIEETQVAKILRHDEITPKIDISNLRASVNKHKLEILFDDQASL